MTDHIGEDLHGLLAGELDTAKTGALLRHVRGCPACADALQAALPAHIALTRAAKAARRAAREAPPSPDAPPSPISAARPRRLAVKLAAAAAVVIVAVGAGGLGYALRSPASSPSPGASASGVFRPVAGGTAPPGAGGTVVLSVRSAAGQRMTITVRGLPPAAAGYFYEIWLLAPATGKMLPVGLLAVTTRASSYVLPAAVTAGYGAVDISLQANDGNPAHSADSVLRAYMERPNRD